MRRYTVAAAAAAVRLEAIAGDPVTEFCWDAAGEAVSGLRIAGAGTASPAYFADALTVGWCRLTL